MARRFLFLSERGWQGARQCALDIAKTGRDCRVIVKGRPDSDVIQFISRKGNIHHSFIPGKFYSVFIVFYLAIQKLFSRTETVFVEREKSFKVVNRLALKNVWLDEIQDAPYYRIRNHQNQKIALDELLKIQ